MARREACVPAGHNNAGAIKRQVKCVFIKGIGALAPLSLFSPGSFINPIGPLSWMPAGGDLTMLL